MDIKDITAVIGTNAWGGSLYGKIMRGSYVDTSVLAEAVRESKKQGIPVFDLARDYGLGKAQKIMGEIGTGDVLISSKYTPFTHYKKGCVIKSFNKDLEDFRREYVDIYWLHLPTDIEDHMKEIIKLYKEGKIRHIGVSNFNLEECKRSKEILEQEGIPLYGVQNHYSIICREWEDNGLLKWCKDNGVAFWGWAVLEEGLLTDPRIRKKSSMRTFFAGRVKKLKEVYEIMIEVADAHGITVPQVSFAFCAGKGVIPICGCRKPGQVEALASGVKVRLTPDEVNRLEEAADRAGIDIMGTDMFRPFVLKSRK